MHIFAVSMKGVCFTCRSAQWNMAPKKKCSGHLFSNYQHWFI